MATVTCHTDGCANKDHPIVLDLDWTDEEGVTHTVDMVICGVCGQPITDTAG